MVAHVFSPVPRADGGFGFGDGTIETNIPVDNNKKMGYVNIAPRSSLL
jgi:hypothetical protein